MKTVIKAKVVCLSILLLITTTAASAWPLELTKSFIDDPVLPGGTVDLEFTIQNTDTADVTGITFTDDLNAALSGLVAVGLPMNNVCGAGSLLSGTSLLTLTGGNLGPGASATFSVTLQVPAGAGPGTFPNTTSSVTGITGLAQVTGDPATDDLTVEPPPAFSKSFVPDIIPEGGVSTLTFTVDNTASALAATSLAFTDTLPAGAVVATPPNASVTCTGGSLTANAGSGTITYSGGSVAAGASCTIQVDVTSSAPGTCVNTTGNLTSSAGNSGTATDNLTVLPAYTVTYDGNGNTGGTAPAAQVKIQGVDLTLASNTGGLVRTGHTFSGWNTADVGSGTHYDEGATYTTDAALTLHAEWTAVPYTVTYDGNGATGGAFPVDGNTYCITDMVTVLGNTGSLEKTGCNFTGWNTAAGGSGTSYNEGDTFAMGSSNVTLYAQWKGVSPAAIPTLSEWGMIIFSLLIASATIIFMGKRNKTGA